MVDTGRVVSVSVDSGVCTSVEGIWDSVGVTGAASGVWKVPGHCSISSRRVPIMVPGSSGSSEVSSPVSSASVWSNSVESSSVLVSSTVVGSDDTSSLVVLLWFDGVIGVGEVVGEI